MEETKTHICAQVGFPFLWPVYILLHHSYIIQVKDILVFTRWRWMVVAKQVLCTRIKFHSSGLSCIHVIKLSFHHIVNSLLVWLLMLVYGDVFVYSCTTLAILRLVVVITGHVKLNHATVGYLLQLAHGLQFLVNMKCKCSVLCMLEWVQLSTFQQRQLTLAKPNLFQKNSCLMKHTRMRVVQLVKGGLLWRIIVFTHKYAPRLDSHSSGLCTIYSA